MTIKRPLMAKAYHHHSNDDQITDLTKEERAELFRLPRYGETQVDRIIRVNLRYTRVVICEMPGYEVPGSILPVAAKDSPIGIELRKSISLRPYALAYKATYDILDKYGLLHTDWHGSFGMYAVTDRKWHAWATVVMEDFGGSLKKCRKKRHVPLDWRPLDPDDDPFHDKIFMKALVKRLKSYGIAVPDLNEEVVLTW